jgi:hypothetical protein
MRTDDREHLARLLDDLAAAVRAGRLCTRPAAEVTHTAVRVRDGGYCGMRDVEVRMRLLDPHV